MKALRKGRKGDISVGGHFWSPWDARTHLSHLLAKDPAKTDHFSLSLSDLKIVVRVCEERVIYRVKSSIYPPYMCKCTKN